LRSVLSLTLKSIPKIRWKLSGRTFVTAMADRAARTWQTSISATLFRALATPQGEQALKPSDLREPQVR